MEQKNLIMGKSSTWKGNGTKNLIMGKSSTWRGNGTKKKGGGQKHGKVCQKKYPPCSHIHNYDINMKNLFKLLKFSLGNNSAFH